MPVALETVVKQLEDSGIVAAGKLENFIPPKAHPKDSEELARQLVQARHLTTFQAQHVLLGKVKALFLGNYTILDKIGAGGMGQVFRAEHRRMERIVAIKMLPPAMTKDAAAVSRFQREVKAAAKLRHSNIVAADDADEANGAHFLVMEYVEGQDLSAHVKKNGPFSVDKTVNYILQAARGLEFAHNKGVVHRDIKPANLLLSSDGVVKILDMGLARIDAPGGDFAAQAELTGAGTVMGTVDYMAPEQSVSTKDADARADIYSLGCSLHFLLVGKPVYAGETVGAKLLAHHHDPIPNLCALRDDVPQQVDAIFRKMVAKKVEDRYQTMTEVIADLQDCGVGHDQSLTMQRSIGPNVENSAVTFFKNIPAVTAHQLKATKKTSSASPGEGKKTLVYGAVGAGMLGMLIFTGIVVSLRNKVGTLIVEVTPPGAMVQVLDPQGKVEVSQNGGVGEMTLSVSPGKHRLMVEKDGFAAFGENFEIESGRKKSIMAKLVPVRVVASARPVGLPKPLVAPFNAAQAKAGQVAWAKHLGTNVETINSVGMRLTLIPPGEFMMGSTPEQIEVARKMGEDDQIAPTSYYFQRLFEELPQHQVTITQPFWTGSTEVTVGQFRKFVEASKYETEAERYGFGSSGDKEITDKVKEDDKGKNWKNPGYPITDDTAVTQVTWNDAVAYCEWLSEQEQRRPWYRPDGKGGWLIATQADGYRLPTEAEWEYACRAGTTTQFSFGEDRDQLQKYGWFQKNTGGARSVAAKLPNPFGLFDIHGNATEWCQDWWANQYVSSSSNGPRGASSGSDHVNRGGSWSGAASYSRSATRGHYKPSSRGTSLGFRIVRPFVPTKAETALASTGRPSAPTAKKLAYLDPAFQQWVADTQRLPAEHQIEAVSRKLMELNPGFDGKLKGARGNSTPQIENGVITGLRFYTDRVADISPVQALLGLKIFECGGSTSGRSKLTDLSPLKGIALDELRCDKTPLSDLSPLQGMPLHDLICFDTQIADLSPLQGMPLTSVNCSHSDVRSLLPLQSCKNLTYLKLIEVKVTSSDVAALQKALPNCKIDWDDPAKAKTREPADSGKK